MKVSGKVELVECDIDLLEEVNISIEGIADLLGVFIAEDWPVEPEIYSYFLSQLKSDFSLKGWLGYLGIDPVCKILVGDCGFLGKPDHFGKVEIGYSVVSCERGKGYAGEMVASLVSFAFKNGASSIIARTKTGNKASMRVLEKCDFNPYMQKYFPDEGNMIFWKKMNKK